MSKIASLLTCEILSLRSMDDGNYSLMGHDAVFIGNLLPGSKATLEGSSCSCTDIMTRAGDCGYSF